jgi:transposase
VVAGVEGAGMTDARLLITAVVVEKRSVAEVAVQYGVSRSWLYELLARYRREGEAAFWLRSRRPRTSPLETPPETVELIVRLRKELCEQGLDAGPDTVCWHLAHHYNVVVSRATVSRYLAKHGLVTPQPRKRPRSSYIRFQAAMPNECWQSDFTQWDGDRAGSTEISLTRARLVPGAGGCSLHQRHRIHEVSYVDGGPARFAERSERLVRCRALSAVH